MFCFLFRIKLKCAGQTAELEHSVQRVVAAVQMDSDRPIFSPPAPTPLVTLEASISPSRMIPLPSETKSFSGGTFDRKRNAPLKRSVSSASVAGSKSANVTVKPKPAVADDPPEHVQRDISDKDGSQTNSLQPNVAAAINGFNGIIFKKYIFQNDN